MSLELASEIWNELKRYINSVDVAESAESLVAILVDHDYNADDIKHAFKGDSDIKRALIDYVQDSDVEDERDDDEFDDFDNDDY